MMLSAELSFGDMVERTFKSEFFIGSVTAYASFPNNARDASYFCSVWERESAISGQLGIKKKQSQVFDALAYAVNKKNGRGVITGLVAISYIYLALIESRASLERAGLLASEAAYSQGHAVSGEKLIKLSGDRSDVKSIFREFRSYAHVWAALLCHENFRHLDNLEERNFYFATMANVFRRGLQSVTDTSSWEMVSFPIPDTCKPLQLHSGPWGAIENAYGRCCKRGEL